MTQKEFFQNETSLWDTLTVELGLRIPLKAFMKLYKKKHHLETVPISMSLAATTLNNLILSGWFHSIMENADVNWKKDWVKFRDDPRNLQKIREVAGIEMLVTSGTTSLVSLIGYHMPSEKGHKILRKLGLTKEAMTGQQFPLETALDYWMTLLASVIAPPREEFSFRGVLYHHLQDYMPEDAALVLSSAIFGAGHGPKAFGATFAMALMATVLDKQEQNIFYSLAWHELNNAAAAVSSLLTYYNGKLGDSIGRPGKELTESQTKWVYRIVGPAALYFGAKKLDRWLKDHQGENQEEQEAQ